MTDFAIRYSYFDRALGRSGHGEPIVKIHSKNDIDEDDGTGDTDQGQGDTEAAIGEGIGEEKGIDLDDPEHREAIELHIKDALTHEYPEHQHGHLVVVVTDCSQVPHLEEGVEDAR
ncbi:MAG: hypothetical protein H7Y39_07205 [Nitrospiraceae bacterium]|nr:hypothetical protein [Nitrospiraceae bacterium]